MATQMVVEPGDVVKVMATDFGPLYFVAVYNDACNKFRTSDRLMPKAEAVEMAQTLRRQQDRMGKASQLVAANAVRKVADNVYEVRSQTHANGAYIVRNGKCQCPDKVYGKAAQCKHELSVAAHERMQEAA